jgi:hypothetical protein
MKGKTRYSDEPMEFRIIPNFLPPPEQLVFREDAVKVTISLSAKSVQFFKDEAAQHGVQYQRMIRRLLDAYAEAFAKGDRAEQTRASYRKAAPRRKGSTAKSSRSG